MSNFDMFMWYPHTPVTMDSSYFSEQTVPMDSEQPVPTDASCNSENQFLSVHGTIVCKAAAAAASNADGTGKYTMAVSPTVAMHNNFEGVFLPYTFDRRKPKSSPLQKFWALANQQQALNAWRITAYPFLERDNLKKQNLVCQNTMEETDIMVTLTDVPVNAKRPIRLLDFLPTRYSTHDIHVSASQPVARSEEYSKSVMDMPTLASTGDSSIPTPPRSSEALATDSQPVFCGKLQTSRSINQSSSSSSSRSSHPNTDSVCSNT